METATQHQLAVAELNPIVTDIAAFAGTIESIDVTDEETQGQLGDLVKMMMHRRKKLEDKRTQLVKPLTGVVGEINSLFKAPRDRIDEIVAIAKRKMNNFARAQQLLADERVKQDRAAAEQERQEATELADALRKKVGDEAEPVALQLVEASEKKVVEAAAPAKVAISRGKESSTTTVKRWKAEVLDIVALALAVGEGRMPPHVLEPSMRALTDISRDVANERTIDGVRYYQELTTQVR